MKIARKHALGLGCLAIVGAITAFAFTLPTGAVSVGGSAEIVVEVYASGAETVIQKPQDGEIFNNPLITFSETHSHAKSVTYYIKKLKEDGVTVEWTKEITDQKIEGEDVSGTSTFVLNMDELGGTGLYIFESDLIGIDNLPLVDSVRFTYAAIETEDPAVSPTGATVTYRVDYTAGVESIKYQLFDDNNNPVTDPVTVNTPNPETGGYMDIEIDLTNLRLESGKYHIVTVGYSGKNASGQVIGTSTVDFNYVSPDSPAVPDTGSLLASLNISRVDYLITGMIAFTGISVAALFIVLKSKKSKR